jgi:hypothetical protein
MNPFYLLRGFLNIYNLSDLGFGAETGSFNYYAIDRARKHNQRAKEQKRRR